MAKMRAVQVARAGGPLELVEREMPEPSRGEVRVRVEACGVCHRDSLTVEGQWPDLSFPRIPGHEIAGVIDAIGAGVVGWRAGQRVGVGWFGGHCGHCEPCRRGWLIDCRNLRTPGISYDGGYAEAMVAPAEALAAIPDEFGASAAAPLLCAGVTTFNALRHSGAMPGDVVAILGIGGLGHLVGAVRKQARLPHRRDRTRRRTKRRSPVSSVRTTSSTTRLKTWRRHSTALAAREPCSRPLLAPRR
jgi:D-arabinose 1-dehydrogenase-like Zn-dependent alcohol dehydrogenase